MWYNRSIRNNRDHDVENDDNNYCEVREVAIIAKSKTYCIRCSQIRNRLDSYCQHSSLFRDNKDSCTVLDIFQVLFGLFHTI